MKTKRAICLSGVCALLAVPVVRAQQQTQSTAPVPAYQSPLMPASGGATNDEAPPGEEALSGVKGLSIGIPTTRSYWQPHFDVSGTADSNALETPNGMGWTTWTSATGGGDIHRVSGNSNMTLSYIAGGMYSNNNTVSNGIMQGLSFVDAISSRRSTISFFDQLSYLPESAFGLGNLGGASLPGGGVSTSLGFGTNQSMLTGRGQNLGNSFATEVDFVLTSRASLTLVGGYSILRYFDSNLLDYGNQSFRAGYNYQLTQRNTMAVLYTFGGYSFSDSNQSIQEHTVQLSYGRRLREKLAFQIAAGPQVVISNLPLSTSGGVPGVLSEPTLQVYWSLDSSLQYQAHRENYNLSYHHGVTGGSGVLAGALTDIAEGSVSRAMSRTFSSELQGGYSRNQGFNTGTVSSQLSVYGYWFGGLNLTHPIGPTLGVTLSYQMQYQDANSTFCLGPTCGTRVVRHLISVGMGWHERPLLF